MKKIEGKKIAEDILQKTQAKIKQLNKPPTLAVILVGDDPASHLYVKLKKEAAQKIGLGFKLFLYPSDITQEELIKNIKKLNQDKNITGIIVQLPLPQTLDKNKIIETIDPYKDADGFHPDNVENFIQEKNHWEPIFPHALMKILEKVEEETCFLNLSKEKRQAIIIGRSALFKKILETSLRKRAWANVKVIDCSEVKLNLDLLSQADLIISSCGEKNLFSVNNLKNPSVVIDGGIVKTENKVQGDFDVKELEKNQGCYSPVPGGVGPVTVACLLERVVEIAEENS